MVGESGAPSVGASSSREGSANPSGGRTIYKWPATALGVLFIVVLLGAVASLVVVQSSTRSFSPDPQVAAPAAPVVPADSTDLGAETGPPPSSPSVDAEGLLGSRAASDSTEVETLLGSWVPQLSSKRPGLRADGRTWDSTAIVQEHERLRTTYAGARLVWTGDFANYRGDDFWATVVAEPASTSAAANAWCDAQDLDGDHCYAVRLTRTGGPEGNSVPRPSR